MDYYKQVRDIFDKWAKDYQKLPEGEEKELGEFNSLIKKL